MVGCFALAMVGICLTTCKRGKTKKYIEVHDRASQSVKNLAFCPCDKTVRYLDLDILMDDSGKGTVIHRNDQAFLLQFRQLFCNFVGIPAMISKFMNNCSITCIAFE